MSSASLSSSVASMRTAVLRAYRELYWLVTRKHADDARMVSLLRDAQMRIRAFDAREETTANAPTPTMQSTRAQDGLRELVSTVGFVRASTSRRGRREFGRDAKEVRRPGEDSVVDGGARRFVVRDGEVVDVNAAREDEDGRGGRGRVASAVLSREDAWAYHNRLIDRQHFGRRLKKYVPEPL